MKLKLAANIGLGIAVGAFALGASTSDPTPTPPQVGDPMPEITHDYGRLDRPTYVPAPTTTACEEDQPCWDCATMGNRLCGPQVETSSTVLYHPDYE